MFRLTAIVSFCIISSNNRNVCDFYYQKVPWLPEEFLSDTRMTPGLAKCKKCKTNVLSKDK